MKEDGSSNESAYDNLLRSAKSYHILTQIVIYVTIGLILFLTFCLLRRKVKFYGAASRLRGTAQLKPPSGIFSWIPWLFNLPEVSYINVIGLDAVVLLEFIKTGRNLFLCMLPVSIVSIIVNYKLNPAVGHLNPFKQHYSIVLAAVNYENSPNTVGVILYNALLTWITNITFYVFVLSYYKKVLELKKWRYMSVLLETNMRQVDTRTVMVTNLPPALRCEVALKKYYDDLGIGNVESVTVYRKYSRLERKIAKRARFLERLELDCMNIYKRANGRKMTVFWLNKRYDPSIMQKAQFSNNLPMEYFYKHILDKIQELVLQNKVYRGMSRDIESLIKNFNNFIHYDTQARELRAQFYGLSDLEASEAKYLKVVPLAFVTFERQSSAIVAVNTQHQSSFFSCVTRCACEPRDVYWPNIASHGDRAYTVLFCSWAIRLTHVILAIFSAAIIFSINLVTSADYIRDHFPRVYAVVFASWVGSSNLLATLLNKNLSTIVAATCNTSLSVVLAYMTYYQGVEFKSSIDFSIALKYFFYQFYNIILVQTITSSVFNQTGGFLDSSILKVVKSLGSLIPRNSNEFMKYVVLQTFVVFPIELLTADAIELSFMKSFIKILFRSTPRNFGFYKYPTNLTSIRYGFAYPAPILMFCIGIISAPVSPFMIPICLVYFTVAYLIRKYVLFYENIPTYESNGKHARIAVSRCFWGILVMQFTMLGTSLMKPVATYHFNSSSGGGNTGINANLGGFFEIFLSLTFIGLILHLPGIILTCVILTWLSRGYHKEMDSIPLGFSRLIEDQFYEKNAKKDGHSTKSSYSNERKECPSDQGKDLKKNAKLSICCVSEYMDNAKLDPQKIDVLMEKLLSYRNSARQSCNHESRESNASPGNIMNILNLREVDRQVEPPMVERYGVLDPPVDTLTSIVGYNKHFWQGIEAVSNMEHDDLDMLTDTLDSSKNSKPTSLENHDVAPNDKNAIVDAMEKIGFKVSPEASDRTCMGSFIPHHAHHNTRNEPAKVMEKLCEHEDVTRYCYLNPYLIGRLPLPWFHEEFSKDPISPYIRKLENISQWSNYNRIVNRCVDHRVMEKSHKKKMDALLHDRIILKEKDVALSPNDFTFRKILKEVLKSFVNWTTV